MLTTEQLEIFKTALFAETDTQLVEYRTNGQTSLIADWYNQAFPSSFIVWRASVSQDEIMQNGFDWTQVDNTTVGKWRIWQALFDNQNKTINPSKVNVRAGIDEAWKGTAAMLAIRAAIYVHCKRQVNRLEKLFATGTGTSEAPASLGVEGRISETDVVKAMSS